MTGPQPIEVSASQLNQGGGRPSLPTTIVRYGDAVPRASVEFREVGIVDQWDLDEIASPTAGRSWRAIALMAMSVVSIDGKPAAPMGALTKDKLRDRIQSIGQAGIEAILEAQRGPAEANDDAAEAQDLEAAHRAQVGNFSETPPSAS